MLKPIEVNKIIEGDALLEIEKLINEGVTVDTIITDPPYNITQFKWDKEIINWNKLGKLFSKILKKGGRVICFGMSPFYDNLMLELLKNDFAFSTEIIWNKNSSNPLNAQKAVMNEHEKIMVLNHKNRNGEKLTYNPYTRKLGIQRERKELYKTMEHLKAKKQNEKNTYTNYINYPSSIVRFMQDYNKIHGTAKPYKLMEHLIKLYTNEGDLVLDPFAGSGTTLLAAKNNNRKYIGIELEKKFYDISKKRVETPLEFLAETEKIDELKNISLFKINETETDYNQHDYKNYSKTSEKNG